MQANTSKLQSLIISHSGVDARNATLQIDDNIWSQNSLIIGGQTVELQCCIM